MRTKYEVSVINCSEHIKGVPQFQTGSRDLSHAPLWINFSSREKGLDAVYYRTKFGSAYFHPFKFLWRGPKF